MACEIPASHILLKTMIDNIYLIAILLDYGFEVLGAVVVTYIERKVVTTLLGNMV